MPASGAIIIPAAMNTPRVIESRPYWAAVWKPHGMHTAPLKTGEGGSLFDWCAALFPEIAGVRGKKPIEGGLLHRLDYETAGLVLFAKSQEFYDFLKIEQDKGRFFKEYTALGHKRRGAPLPGFPAPPEKYAALTPPFTIESGFRHYGLGRKSVRPVIIEAKPKSRVYSTDILSDSTVPNDDGAHLFRIRLSKGFRHQIRAHLAWLGYPIDNESLYGGCRSKPVYMQDNEGAGAQAASSAPLALSAVRLEFHDIEADGNARSVLRVVETKE